jgi:hypothetical protein
VNSRKLEYDSEAMIAALAGRRIDAADSVAPRFPLENAPAVTDRIRSCFQSRHISTLVCSAARGADLLALELAGELGVRRCVVLPGDAAGFRASSVVDGLTAERQGGYQWGAIFDRILEKVSQNGDLILCANEAAGHESYLAANLAILDHAARLALPAKEVLATIVWNLASRGPADVTAAFREEAMRRGFRIEDISTL